jgi:AcrR family transcriptional regulator
LLRAARELFAERGFAATGRDEISERAGVTRGALYHHFDGKEALLRAVVLELEDELVARVSAAALAAPPGLPRLHAGCIAYLDASTEPMVRRISLVEGPAVLGWDQVRELNTGYSVDLMAPALAAAMKRSPDDPDVNVTAHLLVGALNEAALLIAAADQPRKVRRQVAAAFSAFLDRLVSS